MSALGLNVKQNLRVDDGMQECACTYEQTCHVAYFRTASESMPDLTGRLRYQPCVCRRLSGGTRTTHDSAHHAMHNVLTCSE